MDNGRKEKEKYEYEINRLILNDTKYWNNRNLSFIF